MQELKGRPTKVTEGNAKGSYVSYVIEEDVSGYVFLPFGSCCNLLFLQYHCR